MAKMNWELAAKRDRGRYRAPPDIQLVPVAADADFWRLWRDDKQAMCDAGFRVTKVGQKWHAYVQRTAGQSAPNGEALRRQARSVKEKAAQYRRYRQSDAFRRGVTFQEWLAAVI